jgi:O-glycosyl hydrolase
MKRILLFLFSTLLGFAQQNVTIDLSTKYQTMQGFGASDAWNANYVGQWSTSVKEDIAKKLFSKGFDTNGNPEGIGLSRWRFNIGAGSTEQGTASNIEKEERRAECFLNADGTYNWNKQKGQQWFLNAANNYGVEQLVAFVNSPPVHLTKNGRANSDNTNRYGNTNLKSTNYNKFSDFLVTVLKHFSDDGINFTQISPINEPQYEWNSGQEGCPWKHSETFTLVDRLNRDIDLSV